MFPDFTDKPALDIARLCTVGINISWARGLRVGCGGKGHEGRSAPSEALGDVFSSQISHGSRMTRCYTPASNQSVRMEIVNIRQVVTRGQIRQSVQSDDGMEKNSDTWGRLPGSIS